MLPVFATSKNILYKFKSILLPLIFYYFLYKIFYHIHIFMSSFYKLTPRWCPPSPVGLYNVTSITTCGFVVGPTPIKDVTYLFVFTPSSDVHVFPPML